jgi:hypothetical protein
LKLIFDELLSSFGVDLNLRRYDTDEKRVRAAESVESARISDLETNI